MYNTSSLTKAAELTGGLRYSKLSDPARHVDADLGIFDINDAGLYIGQDVVLAALGASALCLVSPLGSP
jgi:hypothetical protein